MQWGTALGTEQRIKGTNVHLGPDVSICYLFIYTHAMVKYTLEEEEEEEEGERERGRSRRVEGQ